MHRYTISYTQVNIYTCIAKAITENIYIERYVNNKKVSLESTDRHIPMTMSFHHVHATIKQKLLQIICNFEQICFEVFLKDVYTITIFNVQWETIPQLRSRHRERTITIFFVYMWFPEERPGCGTE